MGKYLTESEFIEKANKKHNGKYDYSKVKYTNSRTKVCIICPEHGEFWQTPSNHLSGQGCRKCSIIEGHKKQSNNTISFIQKANETHNGKYDYSKVEYKNNREKVCIICPEHGEFWQTPHSHLSGQGCPECNTYRNSKIVQKIENELKKLNIQFEKEKTFDWLKNKKCMYIDFFLPEYNVGIECHGIQHFKPISFFGGVHKYNEQKNRDLLKYKLCLEHGIKIYYFTNIEREYFDKIYCNEKTLIEDICKTI